jgi:two-component system chemotaxis sensor kinase CheA
MDREFLEMLRATFRVEASEHLQAIGAGLLELERGVGTADPLRIIEIIFRAAHSLKGAARAVDFAEIEQVCQSLETLFSAWKRHKSAPTAEALDEAMKAVDQMAEAIAMPPISSGRVSSPDATARPATPALPTSASSAPAGRHASVAVPLASGGEAPAPRPPGAVSPPDGETVRVSVSSLDERLLEAEELLAAKIMSRERANELGSLASQFDSWHKAWARVQPQARLLRGTPSDDQPNPNESDRSVSAFIEWTHDYIRALESRVVALRRAAEHDHLAVGKLVDDLLENSKKLLMLPLATLAPLLHKVVRDLCRDQGKEAQLVLRGDDVKIDKRILEELKDPLIHLLRNCIDHGVETPQQRRLAGKPPRATLALTVAQVNGSQVEIELVDDGTGVDVDKVRAAAVRRGLVAPELVDQLTDSEVLPLVFVADLSTSPMITQVSGRGLGLAIVREKAEKLGGRVVVESEWNVGATIRLTLPLTLATSRGVLIECAGRRFIVPTAQIERVVRFRADEVRTVEGRTTLSLNERAVALVELAEVMQLPTARRTGAAPELMPALILGAGDRRLAFAVDAVLDEREVLVKRLCKPLSRVRNISAATVLGSGEVTPILNVTDLLKSARNAGSVASKRDAGASSPAVQRRVLIAEDSITSRMLLKGILETAGYEVKTAVDGIDAYTTLRTERFDVVVSDVEMPRMNGFDLTAKIRTDETLKELPVVLITALESRDDRERGIDVGANAYLVKSSLDQSNLLEAVRRLA